ncbi:MAG TPA: hypothetical protein VGV64_06770, partial [Thermoplasmata archaeon]|nr:hypothetical protein [Thermoplasmata archaeon]
MDRRAPSGRFGRLGRAIVRHPWYPVVFWIVILLVALPFLSRLPSAEQNSAASLPADAPSSIANAEAARLFPNASPASSSLLLLLGPNVTGPTGERLSLDLAKAIRTDPGLRDLGNVTTLYDAYQGYLTGLTYVTLGVVQGSVPGAPAYSTMSGAATLVWGPPSYFVTEWQRLVDAHPTTPPGDFNAAAENATAQAYASDPAAITVLRAFYGGPGAPGFNGTSKCGADPVRVVACADAVVRSTVLPMLGALAPALPSAFALAVGSALDVVDPLAASAISQAAATALLEGTGLPPSFASTVRTEFPDGRAPAGGVSAWAASVAQGPVASYPLPIPASILGAFVDPGNDASLVLVAFTVPSSFTTADGSSPISDDVARIDGLEATVLASDPAGGAYRILQTGDAAL